jgi:hypothetical protein
MMETVPVTQLPTGAARYAMPNVAVTANGKAKSKSWYQTAGFADALYEPCRGETAVWCSVIKQALMDARSNSTKSEATRNKREALAWFNTRAFCEVCLLADLDPDATREKIRTAIDNDVQWWLPAGQGWRTKGRQLLTPKGNA